MAVAPIDAETVTSLGSQARRPAWEIALLMPDQGTWTDQDYLSFTRHTRRLVEFTDGEIEVLPLPTKKHQKLLWWLARQIEDSLTPGSGAEFITAPYKLKIRDGKFREPDVLLILPGSSHQAAEDFATGADLVIEIVSEDRPERDYRLKRVDYAEAGVREYWIVDAQLSLITLLSLSGLTYEVAATGRPGDRISSTLLSTLEINVTDCFAAAGKEGG